MTTTQRAEISSQGIQKIRKYSWEQAIAEYIWNGLDANANQIDVDFILDEENIELEIYKSISISDNGTGIPFDEIKIKFGKVLESPKGQSSGTDKSTLIHGKNGYGRYTFYSFAEHARWDTTYYQDHKYFNFNIEIDGSSLHDYGISEAIQVKEESGPGTKVVFTGIDHKLSPKAITDILIPYLKSEFAWYLIVRPDCKIRINGEILTYDDLIAETEEQTIVVIDKKGEDHEFNFTYIEWKEKLRDESSRIYMLNSAMELKRSTTTKLNNKGDNFWHSIIVVNDFFDNINIYDSDDEDVTRKNLFSDLAEQYIYRNLIEKLNNFLSEKRRPFLKKHATRLIAQYESEKVFPDFGNNAWDKIRKSELEDVVKGLYEVQPKIFTGLNLEQKKIFLQLLNELMDEDQRKPLLKIIEAVVELSDDERQDLVKILETTRLNYIVATIKLISDRLLMLNHLRQIVFNHEWGAQEVKHLQVFISKHFWIFGEEYRFVCAEEVKFREALLKYRQEVLGVESTGEIDHPDKNREMDLFLSGKDFRTGTPLNIVVEIKNPTTIKKLHQKQTSQIEQYMDVILQTDEFNSSKEQWEFYLIGQDYDSIVERKINDKRTGLVNEGDNYKFYVKKWSEIVGDAENRMRFLLERLKIERDNISTPDSLDGIMTEIVTTKNLD